jgi:hypothetical protein
MTLAPRWTPGTPVVSERDHADWQEWRRQRKREQQRARRATNPRIDYYPDATAWMLITTMVGAGSGSDFSGVLNRIVSNYAKHCHRNKVW